MSDLPTPSEVLTQAADLMEEHGWLRRDYGSLGRGFCALGAISQVIWGDPVGPTVWSHEEQYYAERGELQRDATSLLKNQLSRNEVNIVGWNDNHRTGRGVIRTFRKAAK